MPEMEITEVMLELQGKLFETAGRIESRLTDGLDQVKTMINLLDLRVAAMEVKSNDKTDASMYMASKITLIILFIGMISSITLGTISLMVR